MKKFVLSVLALTMLAGCGVGVGPTVTNKVPSFSALSKESFAKLIDMTRYFVKTKFDEADLDKSGFLTREEAMPSGATYVLGQTRLGAFEVIDANQDGKLVFGELATEAVLKDIAQNLHAQLVTLFTSQDRDSDMVLKGAEIPTAYDLNRNGQVTFSEFEEAYATYSLGGAAGQVRYLFAIADGSRDGKLSFEELLAAPWAEPAGGWAAGQKEAQAREYFNRADANHDGLLGLDEVKAAMPSGLALPPVK